jgi:hypothetical protein
MTILKIQISKVLLTFASEREIGETSFERKAPIGTDMAIEQMKPTVKRISMVDWPRSLKYLL